MRTLAGELVEGNARLRAPLLLFAVLEGKTDLLMNALPMGDEYKSVRADMESMRGQDLQTLLERKQLPEVYLKVWKSYLVRNSSDTRNEELKDAMRQKILRMQAEKAITNYRIYTDLGLNPGNINDWLKNGDSRKVSYQTAAKVVDYTVKYTI